MLYYLSMRITLVFVGKQRTAYDDMLAYYTQRIPKPYTLQTIQINPAGIDDRARSIADEGERILRALPAHSYLIVLDERGRDITTTNGVDLFRRLANQSIAHITCVIGGSYGLADSLHDTADLILRLSSLTLPHELARLVLVEQLYRITATIAGSKYHH